MAGGLKSSFRYDYERYPSGIRWMNSFQCVIMDVQYSSALKGGFIFGSDPSRKLKVRDIRDGLQDAKYEVSHDA